MVPKVSTNACIAPITNPATIDSIDVKSTFKNIYDSQAKSGITLIISLISPFLSPFKTMLKINSIGMNTNNSNLKNVFLF